MIALRTLFATITALMLTFVAMPATAAPTFPPLSGRVVDAAHLLTPDQVTQLTALSTSIQQASTRQFVVATIPDLQGYDIADYGYQLGRAWGIGQKGANNGIILIVAPTERKVRIEVGYGLEPIMTDALANQIIQQQILPKFRAKDMGGGIVAGANAIADQMKAPLEAAETRAQAATAAPVATPAHHHSGGALGLVFWIVIFFFVIVPMFGRRLGGRSYGGGGGVAPLVLWGLASGLGSGSRGGGWGGGSDWGGGGGGGGGFSGGGGSFGGGGASGGW